MNAKCQRLELVRDFPIDKYKEYRWEARFEDGSSLTFVNTGQCIPDVSGSFSLEECYRLAKPFCVGRDVLDCACGSGVGSSYLAEVARSVVGVDLAADMIEFARKRYGSPNCTFLASDINAMPFGRQFDTVVCVDTIEHIEEWHAAIATLIATLRPEGVLLVATPERKNPVGPPRNPYHRFEWTRAELVQNLGRFGEVTVLPCSISNMIALRPAPAK